MGAVYHYLTFNLGKNVHFDYFFDFIFLIY